MQEIQGLNQGPQFHGRKWSVQTQVIGHPRARGLATHGLASSHSFAPKQKEAQSRQKSEVSIHIALMGPRKLACGRRAGKRGLQNAVKTHYSSPTSETCPGEGGAPGPGKGSLARGGSHSWLSDHRSKGQTGRGTWRNRYLSSFGSLSSEDALIPLPCPLSPLSPRTHTPQPYAWPHHTS